MVVRSVLAERPRIELELARLAIELGASEIGGLLSAGEQSLVQQTQVAAPPSLLAPDDLLQAIRAGRDPLGDIFCRIRPVVQRRQDGAFYTPSELVSTMVDWALSRGPDRVVDAGCGSGRFVAAAVRRDRARHVVAVDADPLATLMTRAALAALDARSAQVCQADYTRLELPRIAGRTAFVGNPPYVRHHDLSPSTKAWATGTAERLGLRISGLAGLHALFYLATAAHAAPGDIGCFVTSAEWLDVGYGSVLRQLLLDGLGAHSLQLIDPTAMPFESTQTTALVSCFIVGSRPSQISARKVHTLADLARLEDGLSVPREAWLANERWSALFEEQGRSPHPDDAAPTRLSVFARVHRGLVTGANDFFVLTRAHAQALGVAPWCVPAITDAREILDAGGVVRDLPERKLLLRIPRDVDRRNHPDLDRYLRVGEMPRGDKPAVADTYICSHRRPWWYVGAQQAAPIVASYMARRGPAFALNPDGLALINISHGLYPVAAMDAGQLQRLCQALNAGSTSFRGSGRTYQGGLEKFEPREMEALPVTVDGPYV